MKIMVTGGSGFIGTNLVRSLINRYPNAKIINLDYQTYAARPPLIQSPRIKHIKGNIQDHLTVSRVMAAEKPDHVFHLAAESHVCRSISGPKDFMLTNSLGTWNLIEEFKAVHEGTKGHRFIHVSTDEVFGELGMRDRAFSEGTLVRPRSPYAASKASSDHIVQSYHHTYGCDTVITNCSNNYGENQHAEKLVPKTIRRIFQKQPVEVYQSGKQVRDWIYVGDHCEALIRAFEKGVPGGRYCIGGEKELTNLQMIERLYGIILDLFPRDGYELKIKHTNSRPTDDLRYAISNNKIRALGWKPNKQLFDSNLRYTILWYWGKMMAGGGTVTARQSGASDQGAQG